MKFIVDAHFPVRLANWFNDFGEDATHTSHLPKGNHTPDKEIIDVAETENRIIITKDSDFLKYRIIHNIPQRILLITTGNIVNKKLIQLFENNFLTIRQLFEDGKKVIEIDNESITIHE